MQDLPLFYTPDIQQEAILPETEAGHCLRVLRGQVGDTVLLTDGCGHLYQAELVEVSKKVCRLGTLQILPWQKYWRGELTLALAPTKAMERMEWLLEKAVEVGVDRVVLLRSKHSERKHLNAERLQRIMIGAMKQSQKALLPRLETGISIEELLNTSSYGQPIMLHCREASDGIAPRQPMHHLYRADRSDVCLMIGPEGDFSVAEILLAQEKGVAMATLGESRLRTETAALVALQWVHTLQQINQ